MSTGVVLAEDVHFGVVVDARLPGSWPNDWGLELYDIGPWRGDGQ